MHVVLPLLRCATRILPNYGSEVCGANFSTLLIFKRGNQYFIKFRD